MESTPAPAKLAMQNCKPGFSKMSRFSAEARNQNCCVYFPKFQLLGKQPLIYFYNVPQAIQARLEGRGPQGTTHLQATLNLQGKISVKVQNIICLDWDWDSFGFFYWMPQVSLVTGLSWWECHCHSTMVITLHLHDYFLQGAQKTLCCLNQPHRKSVKQTGSNYPNTQWAMTEGIFAQSSETDSLA